MRKQQKPTVETTKRGDQVETHPAYGVIGASRVSGTTTLFDSDIKHMGFVRLRIAKAEKILGAHEDHVYGQMRTLCEVDLSEAQWVALISRMNIGEGTPCTLRYHGQTPLIEVPGIDDGRDAEGRLRARAASIGSTLDDRTKYVLDEVGKIAEKLGKKDRDRLLSLLDNLTSSLDSNIEFGKSMLREHAEKLVCAAKVEIHAAVNAKITSLGIERLRELPGDDPCMLKDMSDG